jgi:hypothetical protein
MHLDWHFDDHAKSGLSVFSPKAPVVQADGALGDRQSQSNTAGCIVT